MAKKNWKKDIFTIPNMLSVFRLLLIPVYVAIYLNAQNLTDHLIAGSILAVSCLTDMIDGKIARHFNMISTTGKVLDPLADKLTQFTMIVCLAIKYPILIPMIILFVVKELFQLIAGYINMRNGKMLTGALITGKICTAVLFISLIIMVMVPQIEDVYVLWIMIVDSVLLLLSFAHYAVTYFTHTHMDNLVDDTAENE